MSKWTWRMKERMNEETTYNIMNELGGNYEWIKGKMKKEWNEGGDKKNCGLMNEWMHEGTSK